MNAPFLILETGRPIDSMRRHRGFGHWIRVAAGLRCEEAVCINVEQGEALPAPRGWAGVMVSGSAAMVSERADWSERCAGWLVEAHRRGLPLLGICYGHQLLAHAFGGRVDYHPGGREMGTVALQRLPAAVDDPLFGALPERFRAQMTHLQSVLEMPAAACLLARSAHDPHAAFRIGERSWGVQFHPEFAVGHMRGYLRARGDALRREGRDPAALQAEVAPAPQARALLRRFVALSRRLGEPRPL